MTNKKFVKYIKELREEKGLIQQAVAEAMGIPRHKIINFEKGNMDITDEFLEKLAPALEVTFDELREKLDEFEAEEAEQQVDISHLSPAIQNIVLNPAYKDIVESGIMEYLAKTALKNK